MVRSVKTAEGKALGQRDMYDLEGSLPLANEFSPCPLHLLRRRVSCFWLHSTAPVMIQGAILRSQLLLNSSSYVGCFP